jgi:hypothetical protein
MSHVVGSQHRGERHVQRRALGVGEAESLVLRPEPGEGKIPAIASHPTMNVCGDRHELAQQAMPHVLLVVRRGSRAGTGVNALKGVVTMWKIAAT